MCIRDRATVAEVYASVVSDLENAITYLNGTRQITKRRAKMCIRDRDKSDSPVYIVGSGVEYYNS